MKRKKVYAIGRTMREVCGWAKESGLDLRDLVVLGPREGIYGLHDTTVHIVNGGPGRWRDREYLEEYARISAIKLVWEEW